MAEQREMDSDSLNTGTDGLLFACTLDGSGGAVLADWSALKTRTFDGAPTLWMHLDAASPRVREWLEKDSGLTPVTISALLNVEARPRVFHGKRGYAAMLRGVNTNEDADPEDMVAMRLWCDGNRLISLRHRRLLTPRHILRRLLSDRTGPKTIPDLFEQLIGSLVDRFGDVILDYDARIDAMEDNTEDSDPRKLRKEIGELRQDLALVRRHMAPQREALTRLLGDPPAWLSDHNLLMLRETSDQFQRYLEDIDSIRERAILVKEDVVNRLSESMNRNMYVISIAAAIFLPLGFITGLLGINVGGMPGVEDNRAFWITCGLLVLLLIGQVILFRRKKWF